VIDLVLGGGEGLLMSMHGAGCDNLLSATIVLPDGRQVKASDDPTRISSGRFEAAAALEKADGALRQQKTKVLDQSSKSSIQHENTSVCFYGTGFLDIRE
jgi:hypothetical protein